MRLKKLIIVRHGEYSHLTYRLNEQGKDSVSRLGVAIKNTLDKAGLADPAVFIFSSTRARATETSQILAKCLDIDSFESIDSLVSENGFYEEHIEDICKRIKEKEDAYDVIILSAHMEVIDQFPHEWGKYHKWPITFPKYHGTDKATARMIDVQEGLISHIKPVPPIF